MNRKEVIRQLENLRCHSEEMIEEIEPESPWRDDVVALDIAINILKEDLQPPSKSSPNKNTSTELYHENENLKIEGPKEVCLISKDELVELRICVNKANELLKEVGLDE